MTPPGDDAPSVASTTPANGAVDVSRDANVVVTFSEPVAVTSASFALSCETTGAHSFTLSGSSATYTLDPDADFGVGESCSLTVDDQGVTDVDTDDPPDTMTADRVVRFTTLGVAARIYEIQGAAHVSPLAGKVVSGVPGVVTSVRPNSFTMQDASRRRQRGDVGRDPRVRERHRRVGLGRPGRHGERPGDGVPAGRVDEREPDDHRDHVSGRHAGWAGRCDRPDRDRRRRPHPADERDRRRRQRRRRVERLLRPGNGRDRLLGEPRGDAASCAGSRRRRRPRTASARSGCSPNDGAGAGIRTARQGIVVGPADFNPERIQLEDDIVVGATPAGERRRSLHDGRRWESSITTSATTSCSSPAP